MISQKKGNKDGDDLERPFSSIKRQQDQGTMFQDKR